MTPRSVKVFAPASISNLGPGFDVLGVALEAPGDFVVARRTRKPGLSFSMVTAEDHVPADAMKNVAAYVAKLLLREFKPPFGLELSLEKAMPIGSGLGSSAASSVAAAVAVNALLPKPLRKHDLLRFALEGERFACGSLHGDNAAPSLLGGACLVRSYDPIDVIPIPIHPSLIWIVVHPHVVVLTKRARAILPRQIPLASAIRQWGNAAGLVLGLTRGNPSVIRRCVEDVLMEPLRASLIPGFYDAKRAALRAGALGCSISGSGPSVFSIASSVREAQRIGEAMTRAFHRAAGVHADVFISKTNTRGAHCVWRKNR